MTYLDYLNKINYTFGNFSTEVVDIFRRVSFTKKTLSNDLNYYWYNTNGLEKPDITAYKNYNDSDLYHIPLLFNEVYDHTFLPKTPDQALEDESDFQNSKSMFFSTLFPITPIYGDLLVKIDPTSEELDTTSYAYVEEYDPYLRYVKTRSYENIDSTGEFLNYYQLFRQTESGNWQSISESNPLNLSLNYGQTPYAFYNSDGTEVTPYTQPQIPLANVYYGPGQFSTGSSNSDYEKLLACISGNFGSQQFGYGRPTLYKQYISSNACNWLSEGTLNYGEILSVSLENQSILVKPTEIGIEPDDNLVLTIGLNFPENSSNNLGMCFTVTDAFIQSVEYFEVDSIENPLDLTLNANTILYRFMANNLEGTGFSYKTIQAQYSKEIQEKTYIKLPPSGVASKIQGEIKRLLTSGKNFEFTEITGLRVIGSESGETING